MAHFSKHIGGNARQAKTAEQESQESSSIQEDHHQDLIYPSMAKTRFTLHPLCQGASSQTVAIAALFL